MNPNRLNIHERIKILGFKVLPYFYNRFVKNQKLSSKRLISYYISLKTLYEFYIDIKNKFYHI